MAGTFLCPNTCGYGKIVALELSREAGKSLPRKKGESNTRFRARMLHEQHQQFKSTFSIVEEGFNLDFNKFTKKLPSLRDAINKWNFRKVEEKKRYLSTFSRANWEKLPDARKKEHSFSNCKSCALRYADIQALFPVKSAALKGKAMKNPVFSASNEASKVGICNGRALKPSQKEIKNTAKAIYEKVSPVFEKRYNVSLAKALSKVPDLELQHKSTNERRKERRHHYRESKHNIENQMAETAFLR